MSILTRKGGGGGGAGGTPSGPAGGDLSGTYPDPTVTNLIPKTLLDAKGDIIAASAADIAARLAVGTNGRPLTADSAAASGLSYQAQELAYVEFTSGVGLTASTEATATLIVSAGSVTYDADPVRIEFFAVTYGASTLATTITLILHDGSSSVGHLCELRTIAGGGVVNESIYVARRLTPGAGAKTYSVRGYASVAGGDGATVYGGAGGSGNRVPGFIRISRVAA